MTAPNKISIVTELYGNRGLCWNAIDGFQSFILIQKQSNLVIGDRVICNELISDDCTIQKILDQDNSLKKMGSNGVTQNIANNVSNVVIVLSSQPKPNLFLLDKLILIAETNQCKVNIVINKSDLDHVSLKESLNYYLDLGYPISVVSAKEDINKDSLLDILKNESSILLGQSGVGKSTLINWLLKEQTIKTNTLSEKIDAEDIPQQQLKSISWVIILIFLIHQVWKIYIQIFQINIIFKMDSLKCYLQEMIVSTEIVYM